jgi:sulfite oxidase
VPLLDPASYHLEVGGRSFSLPELQARFPHRTVAATMQCAGNRRGELAALRPTAGDPWAPGAIGTAEWTGVALADLLAAACEAGEHVHFDSHDTARGTPFGVSIPAAKATAPEVLLAWSMNGAPLTPAHGAPLRAVVPGYAGIRSAKWLRSVSAANEPSPNPMQQNDYKLFPPDIRKETADPRHGLTIDAMPLNAAICHPAPGAAWPPGPLTLRGYAVAGDRAVARVDVSPDGGATWRQAELGPALPWCWRLWQAELDLRPGDHELVVRAWDSAGQTQPERLESVWNFKGYLCSAWHRVRVTARH